MHHQMHPVPPPQQVAGTSQMTSAPSHLTTASQKENQALLLYIIDYCSKRKYNAAVEALRKELDVEHSTAVPIDSPDGFLFEWWTCFWQVYTARLTPEKNSSKAAKEYSDFYNRRTTVNQIDSRPDLPPNARPGGPLQRVYANGIPPPTANGHGPPNQYPGANPVTNGAQHTPVATPGFAGGNPNLQNNPTLQHLRPGPHGGPIMNNPLPGMQNSVGPGGLPQQRTPNGVPTQANQGLRPLGNPQQPQGSQNLDPQLLNTAGNSRPPTGPNVPDALQQSQDPSRQENYSAAAASSRVTEDSKKNLRTTRQTLKRSSPPEDEPGPKDSSPPERKKTKRSPESLPQTPSLAARIPAPPATTKPAPAPFPQQPVPTGVVNTSAEALTGMPTSNLGHQANIPRQMEQQLLRLQQAEKQTHTNDQQYFNQVKQVTAAAYNQRPTQSPNSHATNTATSIPATQDPSGRAAARPGSMLPPPPPNVSQPLNAVPINKTTPVMSGLTAQSVNGSSPSLGGPSPEANRPGSRPIAGSTPQAIPSASTPNAMLTGAVSTPGGPSSMSVPSPTPQQAGRGQSQSPLSAPRAPATNINGIPTSHPSAMNPQAILNRNFLSNGNMDGITSNNSMMAPSQTITPGSIINSGPMSDPMNVGDASTDPLFGLGAPFDLEMISFQDNVIMSDFEQVYSSFINDTDIGATAAEFMPGP